MSKNGKCINKKLIVFIIILIFFVAISFTLGLVYTKAQLNRNSEGVFFEEINFIIQNLKNYLSTKDKVYLENALDSVAFCEKITQIDISIEGGDYNVTHIMRNIRLTLRSEDLGDECVKMIIKELESTYENKTLFYIDSNIPIYGG